MINLCPLRSQHFVLEKETTTVMFGFKFENYAKPINEEAFSLNLLISTVALSTSFSMLLFSRSPWNSDKFSKRW